MKNVIKEYIEYSEEEKKELWNTATFVFDTNVFLNLYRYSNNTRKQLFDAIEKLKPRIWMPYQVAYEFCKDRYSVIEEVNKRFDEIEKKADQLIQEWKQILRLDDNNVDIEKLKKYLGKWIRENKEKNFLVFDISNDHIFLKILELFDGKTGDEISIEDRRKIEKEGEERFEGKTPPGYKDNVKADNKYGDLFVWKEIIQYSKSQSVDIIFVTHDRKEDWWNICAGKTIGPRVELRKEFYQETQRRFHMYTMTSFISIFNDNRKATIDKETIEEVETLSQKPIREDPYIEKRRYELLNIKIMGLQTRIDDLQRKNKKRYNQIEILKKRQKDGTLSDQESIALKSNMDNYKEDNALIEHFEQKIYEYELLRDKQLSIFDNN